MVSWAGGESESQAGTAPPSPGCSLCLQGLCLPVLWEPPSPGSPLQSRPHHTDITLAPALFLAWGNLQERPLPNPECSKPKWGLAITLVKIPPSSAACCPQDRMQGVTWAHKVLCGVTQPVPQGQLTPWSALLWDPAA